MTVSADQTAEVIALLAAYATEMDLRNAEAWIDLFATNDPRLEMVAISYTARGRDALAAFHARGGAGVHVTGLPVISEVDGSLGAVSPFVYVDSATHATMTGYYRDEFVDEGAGLRFAVRQIIIKGNSGS